jgi:hypothetical protein
MPGRGLRTTLAHPARYGVGRNQYFEPFVRLEVSLLR